jgi:hypothetical protein
VRRFAQVAGLILVLLGVFWAGRESTHGLGAFSEHWWCPIPLVLIVLGAGSAFLAVRPPTRLT